MKNHVFIALFLGYTLAGYSQSWFPLSYSLSVGGTSVTDTHRTLLFQNPALISYTGSAQLNAEYESRYAITELDSKGLQFSLPFSHFTVSAAIRYSGFEVYHEILSGIGFARDFGGKFGMGLQLIADSRYSVETDRYYTAIYPQLGVYIPLSATLFLGCSVFNPFQMKMNYESESRQLASVYSVGTKLCITEKVEWRLQADQEVSNRMRVGTAIEMELNSRLYLQTGVSYQSFLIPALGAGFDKSRFRFNLTASLHPVLGVMVASALSYTF